MSNWKRFEQLAAQIYRELSPHATVVHNDHILGIDSSVMRQIDVSVRYSIANHNQLLIIQARDKSDPADIDDVGEFAAVIQDLRANKGILICRSGFTSGATSLANNRGIDLCNIHDSESRRWSLDISLPVLWVDYFPSVWLNWTAFFNTGDSLPANCQEWVLSRDRGKSKVLPFQSFVDGWNEGRYSRDVGCRHQIPVNEPPGLELLIMGADGGGVWRAVTMLGVEYEVKRRAWRGSFTLTQCRGILHYKDGSFTPSYFDIGSVPTTRDASWTEIPDPNELAVSVQGRLVTTEHWQVGLPFGGTSVSLVAVPTW